MIQPEKMKKRTAKCALIGGTGVYDTGQKAQTMVIDTEYGQVEVDLVLFDGETIAFLARHGKTHSTPPHLINYRANLMALKHLGVEQIFAFAAVGSCHQDLAPGEVVLITDFLDFTKSRPMTFFEQSVKHTDMSDPYCTKLRKAFEISATQMSLCIKRNAVYVCTEGPRFETAAEIRMFRHFGGDVVGMTNVPEVVLAKELGICYSAVGIVTNWCTGAGPENISLHDIKGTLDENKEIVVKTMMQAFKILKTSKERCRCTDAVMTL